MRTLLTCLALAACHAPATCRSSALSVRCPHEAKAGLHAWPEQAPAWVDSWFRTALAE